MDPNAGRCPVCTKLPDRYPQPTLVDHLRAVHDARTPAAVVRAMIDDLHRPTAGAAHSAVKEVLAVCGNLQLSTTPAVVAAVALVRNAILTAFRVDDIFPTTDTEPEPPQPTQDSDLVDPAEGEAR